MLSRISKLPQGGRLRISSLFTILLFFILSSNFSVLFGQDQNFDPKGVVESKISLIKKTPDGVSITLTAEEKSYISANLEGIRARKKVVKRDLKKAQALGQNDKASALSKELEELTNLAAQYYDILYKANKEN